MHTSRPGWYPLWFLPHEEAEMNEHKRDFRRLCLISVGLVSVSAAKELEGFQFILFFGIGAVIFEHVQQIQYHKERRQRDQTGSLLLKRL